MAAELGDRFSLEANLTLGMLPLVFHPKFYYFDTGVYRKIRPAGPLDAPREIDGAALREFGVGPRQVVGMLQKVGKIMVKSGLKPMFSPPK